MDIEKMANEEIIKFFNHQDFDYRIIFAYYFTHHKEFINNGRKMPDELRNYLNWYRCILYEKVNSLCYIVNMENISDEYKKVLMCYNLPFRDMGCDEHKVAMASYISHIFFSQEINAFTPKYDDIIREFKGNNKDEDIDKLMQYINDNNLKRTDWRCSGNCEYPYESEEEIVRNYNELKEAEYKTESDQKRNYIIGRYGEYLVFNEEREKYKDNPNIDVFWVSKDVGDGFGYDIMVLDKNTFKVKLIEVKSSSKNYLEYSRKLTENESNVLCSCYNNPMTSYELRLVYLPLLKNTLICKYEYSIDNKYKVSSNINNKERYVELNIMPYEIEAYIPEVLRDDYIVKQLLDDDKLYNSKRVNN